MKINNKYVITIMMAGLLLSCSDMNSEKPAPQITAQGFMIDKVQEGTVGEFANLKLRIESAGRVKQLLIKERSYEVDLATTPERSHFPLFGIDKKTMLRTDVTLDFQNYINQKLVQPGEYAFSIEIVDKKGQSSSTTLNIHVLKSKDATTPIETGQFQLQRRGKSNVAGGEPFGITWKTIGNNKITISLTKAHGGASKLARFSTNDYDQLTSKEALSAKINAAKDTHRIVFNTIKNAAVDQVFGVSSLGKYYMLKTVQSKTTLSYIGTTVSLNGEYKF